MPSERTNRKQLLRDIKEFSKTCDNEEYTDIDRVWHILNRVVDYLVEDSDEDYDEPEDIWAHWYERYNMRYNKRFVEAPPETKAAYLQHPSVVSKVIVDDPPINDDVDHPSHYTQYKNLEVIDLTEQMNFNRGNAVKYICRAGFKGTEDDERKDLSKARWYISREIERLNDGSDPS